MGKVYSPAVLQVVNTAVLIMMIANKRNAWNQLRFYDYGQLMVDLSTLSHFIHFPPLVYYSPLCLTDRSSGIFYW